VLEMPQLSLVLDGELHLLDDLTSSTPNDPPPFLNTLVFHQSVMSHMPQELILDIPTMETLDEELLGHHTSSNKPAVLLLTDRTNDEDSSLLLWYSLAYEFRKDFQFGRSRRVAKYFGVHRSDFTQLLVFVPAHLASETYRTKNKKDEDGDDYGIFRYKEPGDNKQDIVQWLKNVNMTIAMSS
jgi:hypothetical protein